MENNFIVIVNGGCIYTQRGNQKPIKDLRWSFFTAITVFTRSSISDVWILYAHLIHATVGCLIQEGGGTPINFWIFSRPPRPHKDLIEIPPFINFQFNENSAYLGCNLIFEAQFWYCAKYYIYVRVICLDTLEKLNLSYFVYIAQWISEPPEPLIIPPPPVYCFSKKSLTPPPLLCIKPLRVGTCKLVSWVENRLKLSILEIYGNLKMEAL